MEQMRTNRITVYIDTNKRTITQTFEPEEGEATEDFLDRVTGFYKETIEQIQSY